MPIGSNVTFSSTSQQLSGNSESIMRSTARGFNSNDVNINYCAAQAPVQEDGITVKGSEINQQFNYGWVGQLEDHSRVIILKLVGVNNISGKFIEKPITVQTKKTCQICGKKSRSHLKFCSGCGAFLE
jgi:hypothetical protein